MAPATSEFVTRLRAAGVQHTPAMQALPSGCDDCDLSGYRGRIGIYEMLVIDETIRVAIRTGQTGEELRAIARRNGMKLMHEQALEQVCAGLTTIEEVERVVPIERVRMANCSVCEREVAAGFRFCPYCGAQVAECAESKSAVYEIVGEQVVSQ